MTFKRTLLLLSLILIACASSDPGAELQLEVQSEMNAVTRTPDGSIQFQNDLGFEVHLNRAYLVITSVEILPCNTSASRFTLIPKVFAHTASSSTLSGVPYVRDLLKSESTPVHYLEPPKGSYCRMDLRLGPADEDAEGATPEIVGDMLGSTLRAEGTYRLIGNSAETPFSLSSSLSLNSNQDFSSLDPEGLTLTNPAVLKLVIPVTSLFDSIDFSITPEAQIAGQVVLGVAQNAWISSE